MSQQLKGEKNANSRPCVLLPSPSLKNATDAQVISCNPQEKPLGSGDCFRSLKREGMESEGKAHLSGAEWARSRAPRAWRLDVGCRLGRVTAFSISLGDVRLPGPALKELRNLLGHKRA